MGLETLVSSCACNGYAPHVHELVCTHSNRCSAKRWCEHVAQSTRYTDAIAQVTALHHACMQQAAEQHVVHLLPEVCAALTLRPTSFTGPLALLPWKKTGRVSQLNRGPLGVYARADGTDTRSAPTGNNILTTPRTMVGSVCLRLHMSVTTHSD